MMMSPEWKRLVSSSNKPVAQQEAIAQAVERNIAKTRWWKEIYRQLPAGEKQKILRLGIIGWFSGEEKE